VNFGEVNNLQKKISIGLKNKFISWELFSFRLNL